VSGCLAIVDISSDRVKGNLSDLVAFSTSNFRTAKSSRHLNLDTAAIHSHDTGHCLSHGASVADSLLELLADVLGNELSVELRLSDFRDVHLNHVGLIACPHHSVEGVCELVDAFAAASDDGARSRSEDRNLHAVGGSLNLYAANVSEAGSLLDELSNLVVL